MAGPFARVSVDLGQAAQAVLSQVASCLTHRLRGDMKVALLDACVGDGEGGDHAVAVGEKDAVEVADLLDGAPLPGEFIEHLGPDPVGNDDHLVGPW
jgi:hypothetical protein